MIPTVLVVGLVAGGALGGRRLALLAAVGAMASVLFGLAVGIGDGSVSTFVGGTAFAAGNYVVGAAVGGGVHGLFRAVARP